MNKKTINNLAKILMDYADEGKDPNELMVSMILNDQPLDTVINKERV